MDENKKIRRELISVGGKNYEYFMTSSVEALRAELKKLCCRLPIFSDYRCNPNLAESVREKMAERDAKWSLTTSHGAAVLNFYKEDEKGKGTPYIVSLVELLDTASLQTNFSAALLRMFNRIGQSNLPGISAEWSPIMIAVSQRKIEIVKYLLQSGVSPNFSDSNGFTPLMLAAFLNETEIIKLLVKSGADVNARSKNSFSALIYAIYANAQDAVKVLNESGADLKISIQPKMIEKKKSFMETLNFYISAYSLNGLGDISLIYKKGGMSKQTFSKIRSESNADYHPKKSTVFQLAIGLRLTLSQTESLLESAGYFFDPKKAADRIIKKHIENLDFDMDKINEEIWKETGKAFLKE